MQAAELHAGTCRVILSSSVHYVSRISVCTFTLFTFSKCGAPLTQLENMTPVSAAFSQAGYITITSV